jgi:hypothetical protein
MATCAFCAGEKSFSSSEHACLVKRESSSFGLVRYIWAAPSEPVDSWLGPAMQDSKLGSLASARILGRRAVRTAPVHFRVGWPGRQTCLDEALGDADGDYVSSIRCTMHCSASWEWRVKSDGHTDDALP